MSRTGSELSGAEKHSGITDAVAPSFGAEAWLGSSNLNRRGHRMKAVYGWLGRTAGAGLGLMLVLSALAGFVHARGPSALATPEIDPGSMGSALTLLIGGAFLIT